MQGYGSGKNYGSGSRKHQKLTDPDPNTKIITVLRIRDPVGTVLSFDPCIRDPRRENKSGSGIRIRDEHPRSFFREIRNRF
jgi:hypothetical protein